MGKNKTRQVIILTGPTAAGKTAVAIQLAKKLQTSIISADSRQCFREMAIGVARPSDAELAAVPHYFIASHSIHDEVNAATFESYALNKASEIFTGHERLVMVGGTGLYIKAFCEGLDEIPPIDPEIRQKIIGEYESRGMSWLQEEVNKMDPSFFNKGEIQNSQRMLRALEVVIGTGQSILSFQKNKKAERDFEIIKLGLMVPKEELHERINNRVNQMIESGLVDEVRQLLPFKNLNALQTVGYSEIFKCLDGSISLSEAVERIKINTRQYAKRQMTWFRKDAGIRWYSDPSMLISSS